MNLAEVVDRLVRRFEVPTPVVDQSLDLLMHAGLRIVALEEEDARLAGRLRGSRYDPRSAPLSTADCCALAVARRRGWHLASADGPLLAAALAEGVETVPLPDSTGRVPGIG